MTKNCWRCFKIKDISDFFHEARSKDGHSGYCKVCSTFMTRASEQRNREGYLLRSRTLSKKYYDRDRSRAIMLMGGKCVRCGFSDKRALHIDHINGGGCRDRKNGNYGKSARFLREAVGGNGIKYQLLCANCNWIKRVEMGEHS